MRQERRISILSRHFPPKALLALCCEFSWRCRVDDLQLSHFFSDFSNCSGTKRNGCWHLVSHQVDVNVDEDVDARNGILFDGKHCGTLWEVTIAHSAKLEVFHKGTWLYMKDLYTLNLCQQFSHCQY